MNLPLAAENLETTIDSEKRLKMFQELLRIRMVEEGIAARYSEQEMRCPVHLCIGREAVAVGLSAHLTTKDYAFSTHRAHSHYLAKGGNLEAFIAELYGKATGCSGGRGGSMHLFDKEAGFLGCVPIVGASIPIAVGVAFDIKRRKDKAISVAYFGDGATEEGVFFESLNFARLHQLPMLFVCENDYYSVETSYDQRRHHGTDICEMIESFKVESSAHDGQDLDIIEAASKHAVDKVRAGEGPYFLEFKTQRLAEHCGPKIFSEDDRTYILDPDTPRDPVKLYQQRLTQEGLCSEDDIKHMQDTFRQEIDQAFTMAQNAAYPKREDLSKHIYFRGDQK